MEIGEKQYLLGVVHIYVMLHVVSQVLFHFGIVSFVPGSKFYLKLKHSYDYSTWAAPESSEC